MFNVTGTLVLSHCTLRNFVSVPIYVWGHVTVLDSKIRNNGKGVCTLLSLGGLLNVTSSVFEDNSASMGVVFFINPTSGN